MMIDPVRICGVAWTGNLASGDVTIGADWLFCGVVGAEDVVDIGNQRDR
ncbi:MAG: hypothetical protein AAGI09_10195 [Pseudomonadota bacterium]